MRQALVWLLLVPVLAGCVSEDEKANPGASYAPSPDSVGGDRYTPAAPNEPVPVLADPNDQEVAQAAAAGPPGRLDIGAPMRLPADAHASEPSMAILPDGTTFVVAIGTPDDEPAAVETNVWLWRSRDGATWDTLFAPDGLSAVGPGWFAGDADVVTSPDGWVYVADWWAQGHGAAAGMGGLGSRSDQIVVSRSSDGGDTWEATWPTLPWNTQIDREWLVAGPDGFVGIFYLRHLAGPNAIHAVFSTDHGETFGAPVEVVPPEDGRFPIIAHPVMLADGTLVLPYASNHHPGLDPRARTDIRIMVSEDQGQTWHMRQFGYMPRGPDHIWPYQAATDGEGRLTLTWARRDLGGMSLWTTATPDKGTTWEHGQWLGWGGLHMMPWIGCSPEGACAVAWYSTDRNGTAHTMPADTEWHVRIAYQPAPGAGFWAQQLTDEPVKVGPMCGLGGSCQESRQLLDNLAVQFAPDGGVWVAHAVDVGGEARTEVRRASWVPT